MIGVSHDQLLVSIGVFVVSGSCGWQPIRPALHLLPRSPLCLARRFRVLFRTSTGQSFSDALYAKCAAISGYVIRHPMYFLALSGDVQQGRTLGEQQKRTHILPPNLRRIGPDERRMRSGTSKPDRSPASPLLLTQSSRTRLNRTQRQCPVNIRVPI